MLVLVLYHYYVVVFIIKSTPKQNSLVPPLLEVKNKYKQQNTQKNSLCLGKKNCTKMSGNNSTLHTYFKKIHFMQQSATKFMNIYLSLVRIFPCESSNKNYIYFSTIHTNTHTHGHTTQNVDIT